jgi:hypothetical protein
MVMFATGQPASTTLGGFAAQTAAQPPAPTRSRAVRTIKIGFAAGIVSILAIGLAVTVRQDRPAAAAGGSAPQVPASPPAVPPATPSAQAAAAPVSPAAAVAPPSTTAQPSPPATSPPLPPKPAVTPGDPPSRAAAPLGVRSISITIESTPAGARVFVDGEPTARGTTPYVLERALDATPAEVRLVLAGYRPLKRSIELDRDRKLRFVLDRLAGPASPVARPDRPAAPAPAAARPGRPDRATTEHDDSDDPMDPFTKKKTEPQKKEGT